MIYFTGCGASEKGSRASETNRVVNVLNLQIGHTSRHHFHSPLPCPELHLASPARPRLGAWRLRLDNALAHNQSEERLEEMIAEHGDLELLRLGPYSPMLNTIKGYFSVFKARVKAYLAEHRQHMFVQGAHLNMTEARMSLLEDAATVSISCMNRHLVVAMALHCQRFVADALKMEDMEYGV
ncbi:hypothetical protein PC129_g6784 [Phytophthora cactorum]|uniref:Tc1-like transposase DDE domain-containing protein n=1 Tax=Phytophthora cactorum TaxID=29920 RepID=A0A8T1DWD6_9STRA|nr:hypothetical protein PC112_g8045 [Phytophthora cactorum]KAG2829793.1 hypothetical protein PC111_g7633 [Phytophthora cactorum]KAG2859265.1 hypothetical protein PC113_g9101 [Phytophthora cactorum]KAG2911224.1 hypothetical protein PC114_g9474 [Phytophthora cactorum]KAG2943833.1 hypothetical protein PC117_g9293 [Phytophthora cactorum]